MKGTTIAFANQKGGTSKTTTAVNCSAYLAAHGSRVLLIDCDPQGNATSGLGFNPREISQNLYHGLVGEWHPDDLIKRTAIANLDLLPAGADLAGANIDLVSMPEREYRLRSLLSAIRHRYDYLLIDTPPSLGLLAVNALAAADQVIIPVQCEYYALEGLAELLRTIELVQTNLKTKIGFVGAALTMFDRLSRLHRAAAKDVRKNFPGHVFKTVIPRNVSLAEAPGFGKPILHYAPYSHGAKAYRKLAEEIVDLKTITGDQ